MFKKIKNQTNSPSAVSSTALPWDIEFLNRIIEAINKFLNHKLLLISDSQKIFLLSLVNPIYAYAFEFEPALKCLSFPGKEEKLDVFQCIYNERAKSFKDSPEKFSLLQKPTPNSHELFNQLVQELRKKINSSINTSTFEKITKKLSVNTDFSNLKSELKQILNDENIKIITDHLINTSSIANTTALLQNPELEQETFKGFPEEILMKVFAFLDKTSVATASRSCQLFNRVLSDGALWQSYLRRDFPKEFKLNIEAYKNSPKELYKTLTIRKQELPLPVANTFVAMPVFVNTYDIIFNSDAIRYLNYVLSAGVSYNSSCHISREQALRDYVTLYSDVLPFKSHYIILGYHCKTEKSPSGPTPYIHKKTLVEVSEICIDTANETEFNNVVDSLRTMAPIDPNSFTVIPIKFNGQKFVRYQPRALINEEEEETSIKNHLTG